MKCGWPDCPNTAQDEPTPHLVDPPDDVDGEDRAVYLCADHRALFDRAQSAQAQLLGPNGRPVIGPDGPMLSPEMESFIIGLNGTHSATRGP